MAAIWRCDEPNSRQKIRTTKNKGDRKTEIAMDTPTPSMNDKWIPYKHPQPRESPPELVVPNAIPLDERIWVPLEENVWFRPLCLSASRGYWMNLLRVRRAGVLSRHRHPQPSAWPD
jgi:hypothetical protein